MTEASKYVKDYKNWHKLKSQIDSVGVEKFFHEQEIWWCSVGVNVGYEIDGKNTNFGIVLYYLLYLIKNQKEILKKINL